ncbi:MAG: acetyltransferase [Nitrososphaerota archaeon]|jgi:sugar O-acyltransferase (sialic acid O-acetyltransferase NeuD family)|uniref:acetyltransferase n=1 Tax=Candidatus Bathycorpusculum sp. TaxID=2994959 RepID=UPI00281AACCF|nr:acetyltransferase [Candidatus Termitimicrobium sp.]MCL2431303.1 acetyltransferase [Candidatus Termitimicrobium sp.]MDR0493830.1 acetyltransferase [Nitrososphaerota archaeon]
MKGNSEKLLIIGDGETAELAWDYFSHQGFRVSGFSVEKAHLKKDILLDLPVVPFEEVEYTFNPEVYRAFVAVSYTQLNHLRSRLATAAKSKGYRLATYISPHAYICNGVEIGENCFILENTAIQRGAKIGNNVTIWTGSSIGHRTTVENNCFFATNVAVSGFCRVNENSFLGVHSCTSDGVKIGRDCIVGAGAVVIKDTLDGRVYAGNPAKPLVKKTSQTYISGAETI